MGKFVLETDIVSSHAENFNNNASQMRDMANKIAGYDTSDCEEFNFAGAVAAIASNATGASEKMTNTSKYLNAVVENHTSLQYSLSFVAGSSSNATSVASATAAAAASASVAAGSATSSTSDTTEKTEESTSAENTSSDTTADQTEPSNLTAQSVIDVPSGLGSAHTFMGWQLVTDSSSPQYKLREAAGMNFDSEGFGVIDGRYVVATTTTFGQVGDYVDFEQADGSVIKCIIGDIKNQNDRGCTKWGHDNGQTIVEFLVDKKSWYGTGHDNPGTSSCHPEWNKNVTKATNYGNYFDK